MQAPSPIVASCPTEQLTVPMTLLDNLSFSKIFLVFLPCGPVCLCSRCQDPILSVGALTVSRLSTKVPDDGLRFAATDKHSFVITWDPWTELDRPYFNDPLISHWVTWPGPFDPPDGAEWGDPCPATGSSRVIQGCFDRSIHRHANVTGCTTTSLQ